MTNLPFTAAAFVVVFLLAGTDNAQVHFSGRSSRIALPPVPFTDDYLKKSQMIFHAIEILYVPLWELRWQFLEASKSNTKNPNTFVDLCGVLNHFKVETSYKNKNLPDEFKNMQVLSKAFHQIYPMRTEVSHQSYSVGCFDSDWKTLIEVAKYLDGLSSGTSGQTTTERSVAGKRTETSGRSSTTRRGRTGERTAADGRSRGRSPSLTVEKEILRALGNTDRSSGRIESECSSRSSKITDCI